MYTDQDKSFVNCADIIDALKEKSEVMRFREKQSLFCEGNAPLGVFIIEKGKIKLFKTGSDTKEQILSIVSDGDILAYSEILTNIRFTKSAVTLDKTILYFVSRSDFYEIVCSHPDFMDKFLKKVTYDLKEAESKITDLAYKPVRGRLADALIALGKVYKGEISGHQFVSISRCDLASYVGTARETINRLISEFRNEHLINTEGNQIEIISPAGLQKISEFYH